MTNFVALAYYCLVLFRLSIYVNVYDYYTASIIVPRTYTYMYTCGHIYAF